MELYDWILNASYSGLSIDTIIRVYANGGNGKLLVKGALDDIFQECHRESGLAESTILNWCVTSKNVIIINIEDDPYDAWI